MSTNLGGLIDSYLRIRDKKDALKKKHIEELAPYNVALGKLEHHFLGAMHTTGLESLKSDEGTAYQSERSSVTVADWDAFHDFVLENAAYYLLEKRASKAAVMEVLEDTGALPPGLNMNRSIKVNVRRS